MKDDGVERAKVEFKDFLIRALRGGVTTAADLIERAEVNGEIVAFIVSVLIASSKLETSRRMAAGEPSERATDTSFGQAVCMGVLVGHHLAKAGLL